MLSASASGDATTEDVSDDLAVAQATMRRSDSEDSDTITGREARIEIPGVAKRIAGYAASHESVGQTSSVGSLGVFRDLDHRWLAGTNRLGRRAIGRPLEQRVDRLGALLRLGARPGVRLVGRAHPDESRSALEPLGT
jgi:hypothetical protein